MIIDMMLLMSRLYI